MGETQTSIEGNNKAGGWIDDPEPEPENPKEYKNIKWDIIGIVVEGIYTKKKVDDIYGTTFFFEDKKNKDLIYSVPGTTDLLRKMKDKQPGDILKIEYISDEDIGRPSPLKKFKISTWK